MAYIKKIWKEYPDTTTQIKAVDLNKMDKGIYELTTGWISADETWTYSSVDDPTGVITIVGDKTGKYSLGMRIKFTNGGNVIYGIITKISYSSPNTTLTFLHEINPSTSTALHLMANSAITNNYYSSMKAPYGFPMNQSKWTIYLSSANNDTITSPTSGTLYNVASLSKVIPIGDWNISYEGALFVDRATSGTCNFVSFLSESSSSSVNAICQINVETTPVTNSVIFAKNNSFYSTTTKKTLYIIGKTLVSGISRILLNGVVAPTKIVAVCTYI